MTALEHLRSEHRQIEKALAILEQLIDNIRSDRSEHRQLLRRAVEFLTHFAERLHSDKEERLLFEAMCEHGFCKDNGPVAVMHNEHMQSRSMMQILKRLAELNGVWTAADLKQLRSIGLGYVRLARGHIQKENAVIFPMAEYALPADTMNRLEQAFFAFDREHEKERYRLHAIAEQMRL